MIDIDNPDLSEFPRFAEVTRYEAFLEPGDVLFIPALWFHNVISIGQFIIRGRKAVYVLANFNGVKIPC